MNPLLAEYLMQPLKAPPLIPHVCSFILIILSFFYWVQQQHMNMTDLTFGHICQKI